MNIAIRGHEWWSTLSILRYILVCGFVKLEIILSRSADVIEPSKPWEAGLKLDEEKSLAFAALMHSLVALSFIFACQRKLCRRSFYQLITHFKHWPIVYVAASEKHIWSKKPKHNLSILSKRASWSLLLKNDGPKPNHCPSKVKQSNWGSWARATWWVVRTLPISHAMMYGLGSWWVLDGLRVFRLLGLSQNRSLAQDF